MRRDEPLQVKHTVDFRDQPLLVVANLPGPFADLSPLQARAIAAALTAAAADCEALQGHNRRYGAERRQYTLGV